MSVVVTRSARAQATHFLADGFDFGGGAAVNPNNGWTFADSGYQPLTNYINTWNSADFGEGQDGWEGPEGALHAGWAQVNEDAVFFSGHDLVPGEIVTHGVTNAIYTPDATWGDPFTDENNVSISGTIHNTREFGRSGPWILSRNGNEVLASGFIDDSTLSFNNGPLDLVSNATYISPLATVSGNQFTGLSYEPGDFFNLTIAESDFTAVTMNVESFVGPGNGKGTPVVKAQEAYYRFEEDSGVDIIDSLRGEKHGEFQNTPAGFERSTDVPIATIPQTGVANTKSADLRQGGSLLLNLSKFVFDGPSANEVDGGATLEWYMKVPNDESPDIAGPNNHTSIFWTNGFGADTDRFNIFWDASFTGEPDSDRFISGDWRAPGAAGPYQMGGEGYNPGDPLTEDEWHHIAIVRTDNTPGDAEDYDFTWNWYIDGVLSPGHTTSTTAPTPSPDFIGWTIAGRPGFPLYALIDEVRLTAAALTPEEFLNAMGIVVTNPGDYDDSGQVAQGDLDLVLLNWGKTVPPDSVPPGWINEQPMGLIGQSVLDGVLLNWGNTSAGPGVASNVPEPAAFLMLVTAVIGWGLARRNCWPDGLWR